MSLALIILAVILSLVGGIWFIVIAFRQSVVWGLVVIFVPFASLVFLVKYWQQAKTSFFIQLIGTVLYFAGTWSVVTGNLPGNLHRQPLTSSPAAERAHQGDDTPLASLDTRDIQPDRDEAPAPPGASAHAEPPPAPAAPPAQTAQAGKASNPAKPPGPHRVRISQAHRHIGEPMRITGSNHVVRRGTLREVKGDALVFERQLQGGSMAFSMHSKDIARLESLAN